MPWGVGGVRQLLIANTLSVVAVLADAHTVVGYTIPLCPLAEASSVARQLAFSRMISIPLLFPALLRIFCRVLCLDSCSVETALRRAWRVNIILLREHQM
ncbi:hypothetical protein F4803DRAFT_516258 [Xylaria telfairii]|nr:hypothetical protein F4803DRAFT_516258 [Xylaria telfairii]